MVFLIACLAVLLPVLLGGLIAWGTAGMDTRVNKTKVELDEKDKGYNPALTFGHKIKPQTDSETQLAEARVLAAKQAAALPRGGNMKIGRLGQENLVTAGQTDALQNDPMTAVRIATYHGWDGAKTGAVAVTAAPAVAAPAAKAAGGQISLVPGKDYPVIEITDSMSAEEIRKARIANAKAKSAATKAAKAAGAPAAAPEMGAAQPAAAAAAPAATAVSIEPPQLIEITDGMPPDDVRKARIANSKATSAFNKALKAAGIDPKEVEIVDGKVVIPGGGTPVMAAPAAVSAAPTAAPAATAVSIEPPQLIEITDGMPPDDVRKARIANSKATSAFNKALKAAGIDPKEVEIVDGKVVIPGGGTPVMAAPAAPVAETAAPTATPAAAPAAVASAIPEPNYIEITDDMSPDDVRKARIQNSKMKSEYNKALKAAGIDPKSVS